MTPDTLAVLLLRRSSAPAHAARADEAAAAYVAHLSCTAGRPHPPRVPLRSFFECARAHAAEVRALHAAARDPAPAVAAAAASFSATAAVHAKLATVARAAGAHHRDLWLLFLAAATVLSDDALAAPARAYLVLHAAAALVMPAGGVDKLCAETGAPAADVRAVLARVHAALPRAVLEKLPAAPAAAAAAEAHYQRALDGVAVAPARAPTIDGRVFVDSPHLVEVAGAADAPEGAPRTDPPVMAFAKYVRSDAREALRRARPSDALDALALVASETPRSPAVGLGRDLPRPRTRYAQSPGQTTPVAARIRGEGPSNAGNASGEMPPPPPRTAEEVARQREARMRVLATPTRTPSRVASPRIGSAARPPSGMPAQTPITQGLESVSWLRGIVESRPEVVGDALRRLLEGAPAKEIKTTPRLNGFLESNEGAWTDIVALVKDLCQAVDRMEREDRAASDKRDGGESPTSNGDAGASADGNRNSADPLPAESTENGNGRQSSTEHSSGVSRDSEESDPPGSGNVMDEDFIRSACALYFGALENILVSENTRLSPSPERASAAVGRILGSRALHKSLFSCSLESVTSAYGIRRIHILRKVLKPFELAAFDLTKCIETFVKQLVTLPPHVKNHIAVCEIRLLEADVWCPPSPLVQALAKRRDDVRARALHRSLNINGGTTGDGGQEDASTNPEDLSLSDLPAPAYAPRALQNPSPDRLAVSENGSSTSTAPTAGRTGSFASEVSPVNIAQGTPASALKPPKSVVPDAALELFYLKFLSMAAHRMHELLFLLGLQHIETPVWQVIKYCSWQRWQLMVGRHLDQILLCAVYGIARMRQLPLTFKDIIRQYRLMPHAAEYTFRDLCPGTFCNVSLAGSASVGDGTVPCEPAPRGDIIKFYNQVFIHETKTFLRGFKESDNPQGDTQTPATNTPDTVEGSPNGHTSDENAAPRTRPLAERPGVPETESASQICPSRRASHAQTLGMLDPVHLAIEKSPMRPKRRQLPSRVIGSVTVSPMSRQSRTLASLRQSPSGRTPGSGHMMTPSTRRLYAFGESPSRDLDRINRTLSMSPDGSSNAPPQFDHASQTEILERHRRRHIGADKSHVAEKSLPAGDAKPADVMMSDASQAGKKEDISGTS